MGREGGFRGKEGERGKERGEGRERERGRDRRDKQRRQREERVNFLSNPFMVFAFWKGRKLALKNSSL